MKLADSPLPLSSVLAVVALLLCSVAVAWGEPTSGEPPPQSFDVFAGNADASNKDGGIVGRGGYYYAVVTVAPRWEMPDDRTLKIMLDSTHVTKKEIKRQNPGGLGAISWGIDLMDMDHPEGLVRDVTATFDLKPGAGPTSATAKSSNADGRTYTIQIPKDASRLTRFDVHWKWNDKNDKVLQFAAQAVLEKGARIYIARAEPPYHAVDTLSDGDRFRVEVVFDSDPGLPDVEVTIRVDNQSEALTKRAHRVDSVKYTTDPIMVVPSVQP